MLGASLLVVTLTFVCQEPKPGPPPLTTEQRKRIAQLVNSTQRESERLKVRLEERQQALAGIYAAYELDEKQALQAEQEILELQKEMLASFRKMQVELRAVVEKERFLVLKQRLDRFFNPPEGKAADKNAPKPTRP